LFYIPSIGRFAAVSVQTRPGIMFGNPVTMTTTSILDVSPDVRNYDITPSGTFVTLVDPDLAGRRC
jgi:hypothetical protein